MTDQNKTINRVLQEALLSTMEPFNIEGHRFEDDRASYLSFLNLLSQKLVKAINLYAHLPYDGLEKLHDSEAFLIPANPELKFHDRQLHMEVLGGYQFTKEN
jgi:hypothetical protein